MRRHIHIFLSMTLAVGLGLINAFGAPQKVNEKALIENRALDRRFLEAFQKKDPDKIMKLYWKSPDLVVIFPEGAASKGWDNVRKAYEEFFAGLDTIRLEMNESMHWPSGDGVLGFGMGTVYVKPKGGTEQQMIIRFTDYRQKQGGQWVYAHDHTHMVTTPQAPRSDESLYRRLGGYDAIAAVVDDFLGRLMADPQLKRFFNGVGTNRARMLRQLIVDQLCAVTKGPCAYVGRDMRTAHAGLGISEQDWQASASHLVATLDKLRVPEREKSEVLTALSSLKSDIVEK